MITRRDVLCLGKYSVHLNAKAISNEAIGEIIVALRKLHPQAIVLNLSRECLNEATFTPVKNYETEELEHSRLSLPNGTLLIIDETRLTPGQLTEVGTRNISKNYYFSKCVTDAGTQSVIFLLLLFYCTVNFVYT